MLVVLHLVAILQTANPKQVVLDLTSSDPAVQASTLKKAEQLRKQKVQVEIVCHDAGIGMMKTSGNLGKQMAADAKSGVVFASCSKSMGRAHLTAKDVYGFATIVDGGRAELERKKKAGWTIYGAKE